MRVALILGGLSALFAAAVADPCDVYAQTNLVPLSKARACDSAISAHPDVNNKDALLGTFNTIEQFYQGYAYRDYDINSGPPYNVAVDVRGMIDKMRKSVTESGDASGVSPNLLARGLYDEIASAFVAQHDAHTIFIKPKCLGIQLIAPIALTSSVDANGAQRVNIAMVLKDIVHRYVQEIDPSFDQGEWESYAGATVVSIDGEDALMRLMKEDTFISKDAGPRLNYNLESFFLRPLSVFPLPANDTVTLTLKIPGTGQLKTKTLMWGAFNPVPGSTVGDLAKACTKSSAVSMMTASVGGDAGSSIGAASAIARRTGRIASGKGLGGSLSQGAGGPPPVLRTLAEERSALSMAAAAHNADRRDGAGATDSGDGARDGLRAGAGARPPVSEAIEQANEAVRNAGLSGGRQVSRSPVLEVIEDSRRQILAALGSRAEKPVSVADATIATVKKAAAAAKGAGAPSFKPIYEGHGFVTVIGVYNNGNPTDGPADYCIAKVPSFMPPGIDNCSTEKCSNDAVANALEDISKGVNAFAEARCARIAVDVVKNGGGMVCLGYRLLSQLVRGFNNFSDGQYDIIQADWVGKLVDFASSNGVLGLGVDSFADPKTGKPFTTFADFWDGPQYTRGGRTSKYSKKSLLPCDDVPTVDPPTIYYPISRIAIVSDGQCGSTCELFLQKAQNVGGIRVSGIGGIYGTAMDASSFGGGNVLDTANLLQIFGALKGLPGFDFDAMPPAFPTTAGMTFDFREMYSFRHPDTVLEWGFYPAASRLAYWPSIDPLSSADSTIVEMYTQFVASDVYQDSNACETDTAIPCALKDGTGYQICNGGIINADICESGAPPAPDHNSEDPGAVTPTPSPGENGHDGHPHGGKKSGTSKLLIGLVAVFGFTTVLLAVLLVIKSRPSHGPAGDPILAGTHDGAYQPPRH